jgi:Fe2+ or Zn2+ uptake regulation protein
MNQEEEKQLLTKLRKYLPKKYASIIHEQESVSVATVYNVLNGTKNQKVLDALVALAKKGKEQDKNSFNEISELVEL